MWMLVDGTAVGIEVLADVCRGELAESSEGDTAVVRLLLPGFRRTKRRRLADRTSPFGENCERTGYMQIVEFDAETVLNWLMLQGSDEEARDRAFEGH